MTPILEKNTHTIVSKFISSNKLIQRERVVVE
jgi:hypothetical protein